MRYAFFNQDGTVVNTIVGQLTTEQQSAFLADYSVLFDATQIVPVEDDSVAIHSGGTYANGQFLPPVQPVIVEGTATMIEEPQPEPLPEPTEPEL